jgi:MBG domain/Bacterial Ig-like domain (group 3)
MQTSFRSLRSSFAALCSHCKAFTLSIAALFLVLSFLGAPVSAQNTTIGGTVYMPNGTDVLPNVLVYVTTGAVTVPASGAKCPGTAAAGCIKASTILPVVVGSGTGVYAYTYTAVDGTFTLSDVPENTDFTLVIQSGKWMSEFTEDVGTTAITEIVLEMPSSHNAGYLNPQPTSTLTAAQGNIPLIAVATGSADAVECVLRKTNYGLGLNDCEFTDDAGNVPSGCSGATGGRIHFYQGDAKSGAVISSTTPLETAFIAGTGATPLSSYDLLMLPCQGLSSATETNANIDKLIAYTSAGGRVFATHFSDVWLDTTEEYSGAGFSGAATFTTSTNATAGSGSTLGTTGNGYGIGSLNTDFTAGSTLSTWLYENGYSANGTLGTANSGTEGEIEISTLRINVASAIAPTQTWLMLDQETGSNYTGTPIMQMSFNTPVGAAETAQYGRVMFNDSHVENVSGVSNTTLFPAECPTLSGEAQVAQEKVLEYGLFDLTNAVTPVVVPSMTITLGNSPATFYEGDSADTITVDITNGSTALSATTTLPITLGVTLPSGLTATAIAETDSTGGWSCSVSTLTCTQTTGIAASANYAFDVTVGVAANATAGATSASETVAASVSSPTFSATQTGTLSITADEHAAVTWATPSAVTYGSALSSTQLDAVGNAGGNTTPNANGTYVYSPVLGTVLSAGSHALSVTYTPGSGYPSYTGSGTASVTLTVNQATPTSITWPTATNLTYGQTLASSTLSGGASTPAGTFVFTTPTTAPPVGTNPQSVTFTPTDTTDYTTVVGSANVTVTKATPSAITWPTATNLTYGQTLASSTLSGGASTPAGTFVFTTPTTAPPVGTNPQSVTFTPTDTTDYNTVVGSANVTVTKATATVTLTPSSLNQTYTDSPLSVTSTTNPAGLTVTYTYNGSSTAPITAGSYAVVATIIDPNYIGSTTGTLIVSKAVLGMPVVLVTSSANPIMAQSAVTFTATISSTSGQPTGTVNFLDGTTVLGEGTLSGGVATLTTSSLAAGTHSITASYSGDSNFAAVASGALAQTVLDFTLNPVSANGASGSSQTVNSGAAANYTLTIAPTTGTDLATPTILTVSGMPTGATAIITSSSWTQLTSTSWSFPASTTFSNFGLTVQVPAATVSQVHPVLVGRKFPPLLWGFLLLPFASRMRRTSKRLGRSISALLLLVLGMTTIAGIGGCASGSGTGTSFYMQQAKTYTIIVTATSSALTHSTTLTLTVQ